MSNFIIIFYGSGIKGLHFGGERLVLRG